MNAAEIKKAIVAAVGFALTVLSACLAVGGIIPVQYVAIANSVLAVAGTLGVYQARNARPAEQRGKHEAP